MKPLTEPFGISVFGKRLMMRRRLKSGKRLMFARAKIPLRLSSDSNRVLEESIGISAIGTGNLQHNGKKRHAMPVDQNILLSLDRWDAQQRKDRSVIQFQKQVQKGQGDNHGVQHRRGRNGPPCGPGQYKVLFPIRPQVFGVGRRIFYALVLDHFFPADGGSHWNATDDGGLSYSYKGQMRCQTVL